ncbi:MAG TPA: M3 family metallopeptidase [Burkholderiales bacterium]|nr:M3 family metallopeptidase [Burkholderiales bacterium]
MNSLLDFSGLPRFADFKTEFVAPAVDQLLVENRALVERISGPGVPPTWRDFVEPMEDANERLHRAWGVVGHLNAVMNSPELREAYNTALPKVTQYYTELGQNETLFAKFKALRASPGYAALTAAQKKIIENELRDFRLGGAELPPEKKSRFKEISERLSQITSRFSDNLLDATNAFAHFVTDPAQVTGIPEDVLTAAREAAQSDEKPGWKFTLHAPSYLPVMQYADHRPLRELMYRAYVTRASEFGKPEWDNTPLITEILKLRREQARLLGFENYAEYSLEAKMAESPRQVLNFLDELAAKAKPYAKRDLDELTGFARAELGLATLEAWDMAYASEKLRAKRYSFSDQEVKQYFPETRVLPGMFKVVETLYGLKIEPSEAPTWHPDVRFFSIRDRSGNLVGQFYVDLYARPSKRGGAWMDEARTRRLKNGNVQTPVAYLNCNFSAPVGGKPALFTHDEVNTLFHEFGHGLHHLLTRVDYLGVSGINGVEWDAVELPSQFMENFCWEWSVLPPMTARTDTSAPLPRALFDKMLAAKNFQSGMQTVRQIEFSLFDLHAHYDFDPTDTKAGAKTVLDLLNEVRSRVAVVFPPAYNRFPNNFSHIFAGGYAAGYYSYKWAEVLSADAYSLFEEKGVLDPETGQRFRDEILGVGGSRPALESFVAFRGREPKIDALLRHNGMA